jgi:hypothetical protein
VAAPTDPAQKILYLDYDGVLHHAEVYWKKGVAPVLMAQPSHTAFKHTHLLEQLVEPYPDLKIVLSTSWARMLGFSRARRRLKASTIWLISARPQVAPSVPKELFFNLSCSGAMAAVI